MSHVFVLFFLDEDQQHLLEKAHQFCVCLTHIYVSHVTEHLCIQGLSS